MLGKKKLLLFLCAVLLLSTLPACSRNEQSILLEQLEAEKPYLLHYSPGNPLDPEAKQTISHFSQTLFSHLLEEDGKSLVLSPFSAYFSIAMASLGAHEETRLAFREVLGYEPAALAVSLHDLLSCFKAEDHLQLSAALWLSNKFYVADDFSKWMVSYFHSPVQVHDFLDPAFAEKQASWFSAQNPLFADTSLSTVQGDAQGTLLLNTFDFSITWATSISPVTPFANSENLGNTYLQTTPATLQIGQTETLEAVLLPLATQNVGLLLVSPLDPEVSLSEFVANTSITSILAKLSPTENVAVSLPQIQQTFSIDLSSALQNMGLEAPFDPQLANLSGFIKEVEEPVSLLGVLHATHFQINEVGINKLSHTESETAPPIFPEDVTSLSFQGPFLYILYDFAHNIPLIMGSFHP